MGRITVLSPLGQSLRAELEISASREELQSMTARLASAEAFKQAGIEYVPAIAGIQFSIDKRADGQPVVRLSTSRPMNEPFLDILVELTWASGRMVREYTVLLDPPEALSKGADMPLTTPEAVRPVSSPPGKTELPEARETTPPFGVPDKSPRSVEPSDRVSSGAVSRLVKSGDTLAKIATATIHDGVTLDQMLVALLRGNPDAFDAGNMNRLRAGKILAVPDAAAVSAIEDKEARRLVVAQARDFNAYRKKLAASVAASVPVREETAKQSMEGKIAPKVEEKVAAPTPAKDKLEVSRTEATKEQSKDLKAAQGRVSALEEDLVARDKALKEANSRVAELEKNLSDLKRLAELKSQMAAQMQQSAQAAKAVQPPDTRPVESKQVEAKTEPKPAEPKPVDTKAEVKLQEAPLPAAKPVAPMAKAPASANKPVLAAESPLPEPSFVEDNPSLVYGGAGVLALLLGYLGYSSWRRKRQLGDEPLTTSRLTDGDLTANSIFGATGGHAVDTGGASIQTDFSQANLTAMDADEGVDPVAEADVYLAYGREAQAEEILVDAMKHDPSRHAVHLKLLEIYSGKKDVKKFDAIATDLHGQTGGIGPEWEKAAGMGRSLNASNILYFGGEEPARTPAKTPSADLAATTVIVNPAEAQKLRGAAAAQERTAILPASPIDTPVASPPATETLDFDLDLSTKVIPSAADKVVDMPSLDFDLDLDGGATAPSGQARTVVDKLDVDLSLAAAVEDVPTAPELSATTVNLASLDFDAGEQLPGAASPTLDFSAIDLDLDTPTAAPELGKPSGSGAGVVDQDNPEVATKLELAQAYEEMGDKEGARELLQEVLQEGSSQQREQAKSKLATLDA
jgi:pilus assembly protein FimV